MTEKPGAPSGQHFRTRLSHAGRAGKRVHGFVNPPLLRGSTVLYPTVAERRALAAKRGEQVLTYGLGGSETHWALEDMIAEIEGGTRCLHRRLRPRRGHGAAAGLSEGGRSLPDAGFGLWPGAQLRHRHPAALRNRDHVLSDRRSTRRGWRS